MLLPDAANISPVYYFSVGTEERQQDTGSSALRWVYDGAAIDMLPCWIRLGPTL